MDRLFTIGAGLVWLFAVWALVTPAEAIPTSIAAGEPVIVCPVSAGETSPPSFADGACNQMRFDAIDPQNAHIWIKAAITLQDVQGPSGEPLALYVFGKMSSAVYLNGHDLGMNGVPGRDRQTEKPGVMYAAFYPQRTHLRAGRNDIIIRASSHAGFLTLNRPVHALVIAPSRDISQMILKQYWPASLSLGLFLAGAVYFAMVSVRARERWRPVLLGIICGFAAAQLIAEVWRGLIIYAYPVHEIRLILITVFSAGFGVSVACYVTHGFVQRSVRWLAIAVFIPTIAAIAVLPSFDMKAAAGVVVPMTLAVGALAVVALRADLWRERRRALIFIGPLLVFVASFFIFPSLFLDAVFFLIVSGVLLCLFMEHGAALSTERLRHLAESVRADRLDRALQTLHNAGRSRTISIRNGNATELIDVETIALCRGAGDYVEIVLTTGRQILHNATLAEMEDALSVSFLRVHRSYLVNMSMIDALERDTSGTGSLLLRTGVTIPVSRRIMPRVRKALTA